MKKVFIFFSTEWLLSLSMVLLIAISLFQKTIPHYNLEQLIPIFLLWTLFVAVKGIEESGLLVYIAQKLEAGLFLAPKLVILSFIFSIILSIDVTLVAMLPLILSMQIKEKNHLLLLVAFTAHVGAALTPFGTPQNLFIFSFYQLKILPFIQEIAPFSLTLFILFLVVSFFIPITSKVVVKNPKKELHSKEGIFYLSLLAISILAILHVYPWYISGIVLLLVLFWDRKVLLVDYPLLLTFLLFIALANSLSPLLSHYLEHPKHVFILSSLLSQGISNVPTTLLLHQFTPAWQALLWGTNVGGFGTLIAALANLITYRIYTLYEGEVASKIFMRQMIFWGFVVYGLGVGIYFIREM